MAWVKKTVKGKPYQPEPTRNSENIQKIEGYTEIWESMKLHKFFADGCSHSTANFKKGMLYVFTTVLNAPSSNVQHRINMEMDKKMEDLFKKKTGSLLMSPGNPLFDFSPTHCAGTAARDQLVEIKYRDRLVGYYYLQNKTFVCADLTHLHYFPHLLEKTLKALIDGGYLTELTASEKKEMATKEQRRVPVITLGCDPEYEYYNNGGVSTNLPRIWGREANCMSSDIGKDGSGNVYELRPKPSRHPGRLVRNMRKLFKRLKKFKHISTIGNVCPIGCHIHFGVGGAWRAERDMINMLDDFLGRPCMDMNGHARGRGHYGALSDFRSQSHGLEYRTLPSAVTSDPRFFKLVLTIGKELCRKYIQPSVIEYYVDGSTKIPSKESYIQLCNLTEDDYDYFFGYIREYKELLASNRGYCENFISRWIEHNVESVAGERDSRGGLTGRDMETVRAREEREAAERCANRPAVEFEMPPTSLQRRARRPIRHDTPLDEQVGVMDYPDTGVRVIFNDTWGSNARDAMVSAVNESISPAAMDGLRAMHYTVFMFGLAEQRGDCVFGFDHEEHERMATHPNGLASTGSTLVLGIPHWFRTRYANVSSESRDGLCASVGMAVQAHIESITIETEE